MRDSIHGKDNGADWVRSMFSQKDYGSGYTYPSVGGFIDLDPLPLPNLDGDDPSMGLDIMTSSVSCNSTSRDYEVRFFILSDLTLSRWLVCMSRCTEVCVRRCVRRCVRKCG